jgi:rhizosphere induced protein
MMSDVRFSRRQGLAALGAAVGTTLVGTALSRPAAAVPAAETRTSAAASTGYQVKVINNSEVDDRNAILFQEIPKMPEDAVTLAWLSKMCHAGTEITHKWNVDYNFVWGQAGSLAPGTMFEAGQKVAADLERKNTVTLMYEKGGFKFGPSRFSGKKGLLYVNEDRSVPGPGNSDQGVVGVGMSGFGTFIVPTLPNNAASFTPKPTYYLAFGKFEQGEVMDINQLTNPEKLQFKNGTTKAVATFDGTDWEITFGA